MNLNLAFFLISIQILQSIQVTWSSLATSVDLPEKEEIKVRKTCTYDRVYKKIGCDCANMDLKEVPRNLRTNIEIFDLSFNRIRELNTKSFARYTDIKFLYLFENMIRVIQKNSFASLKQLEAIDLSTNVLTTIPAELFALPKLRNLHIVDNHLIDLPGDLQRTPKPIVAPLQILNMGNCQLRSIPDFGILPNLLVLNVSNNPLDDITPQQFSPFCQLMDIDIQNATEIPPCVCNSVRIYIERRQIKSKGYFECPSQGENVVYCAENDNSTLESPVYHTCLAEVTQRIELEKSRRTWLTIVCALVAFFIIFIGLLYCMHRRNVKLQDEEVKKSKLKQIIEPESGNSEVLLMNGKC